MRRSYTITHDGVERAYHVYIPRQLCEAPAPSPLIVYLHAAQYHCSSSDPDAPCPLLDHWDSIRPRSFDDYGFIGGR